MEAGCYGPCSLRPSPTGRLHVGNIYIALNIWLFAKRANGRSYCASTIPIQNVQRSLRPGDPRRPDLAWLGLGRVASRRLAAYDTRGGQIEGRRPTVSLL